MTQSLMQQALGKQWEQLPKALQSHYNNNADGHNVATGRLTINYPNFMQWPFNALRLAGALVNRRGKNLPTTVERKMQAGKQYWHRTICFPDGKEIHFKSLFVYIPKNNEFIEYTNRLLGLKMKVHVENEKLIYESCGYVLKLGSFLLPIPESLSLGHASIIETAVDEKTFDMDFRLKHPLLGEIFSYKGQFTTL